MVVVGDEVAELGRELTRQIVVLEQDAGLERLMPSLDLAPCHRMIWGGEGLGGTLDQACMGDDQLDATEPCSFRLSAVVLLAVHHGLERGVGKGICKKFCVLAQDMLAGREPERSPTDSL